jgi:transmembrane sensor
MSDRPQNDDPESISEQAADWLLLIRAGEMSEQQKLEYIHWLKRSPAHVQEILELVSLEQMLRDTHAGGLVSPPEADPADAAKVLELPDLQIPNEK